MEYLSKEEIYWDWKTEKIKVWVKDIMNRLKENKKEITSYYAVLKFDGDGMENFYREPQLKEKEKMNEFHTYLSKEILDFAVKAKRLIQPEEGFVVNAGGEDFLGFLSLNSMLPVLIKLRKEFGQIDVSRYLGQKNISFSAGVTVAHVYEPLYLVIGELNRAEKYAKEIDQQKDAVALSVMSNSGSLVRTRMKFGENCANLELFQMIVKLMQERKISASFSYKLMERVQMYQRLWKKGVPIHKDVMVTEIKRLLNISSEKEVMITEEEGDLFYKFYEKIKELDGFSDWLRIASFLQREADL